jgi:ferredoxin--NADP+ reductase
VNVGESILDLVGPLGHATNLEESDNTLLVAGGIGIAVLYPQAKYLKSIGKKVTCVMGARDKGHLTYVEKMQEFCDELIVMTDDGSYGKKGFVTVAVDELLNKNEKGFDLVFAVGPLRMMEAVCKITKRYDVHTVISMNPIMIDGTGMCGSCRLTVDGKTKYACVDGPEFDGHQVDFNEVISRNDYYKDIEAAHRCRLTGEMANGKN